MEINPDEIEIIYALQIDDPLSDVSDFMADMPNETGDDIFDFVKVQPQPQGGYAAFYEFVSKELKYPMQARKPGTEGTVYLEFIVDKDGFITDVKILKGIGGGCDEEAIRVLENAPEWLPGRQGKNYLRIRMRMPFVFRLEK